MNQKYAQYLGILKQDIDESTTDLLRQMNAFNRNHRNANALFECLRHAHSMKAACERMGLGAMADLLAAMEHVFRALKAKKIRWSKVLMALLKDSAHALLVESQGLKVKSSEPDFSLLLKSLQKYRKPLY